MLKNRRTSEQIVGYFFIIPALMYMCIFIGYPLVYNFVISFKNLDVSTFKGDSSIFIGLGNYKTLFQDPIFLQTIRNTFFFTVVCLFFQFSIGFVMALLFSNKNAIRGPLRGLMLISYMMPMAVTGLVFKNMFATHMSEGVINYILGRSMEWLIQDKNAMIAVIVANCWVGIPFNMLLLTTGMTSIPPEVYESASIDGANFIKKFAYITLPLLRPAILSVLMLGFIYTFKIFDLIYIMTGGGPLNATQVLSTYSYKLSFNEYKFSMGAAGSVVLFACLMVVGVVYLILIKKEEYHS